MFHSLYVSADPQRTYKRHAAQCGETLQSLLVFGLVFRVRFKYKIIIYMVTRRFLCSFLWCITCITMLSRHLIITHFIVPNKHTKTRHAIFSCRAHVLYGARSGSFPQRPQKVYIRTCRARNQKRDSRKSV